MALKKSELVNFNNMLTAQQEMVTNALELKIDEELRANYTGTRILIRLRDLPTLKIQQEIERRYRLAGWSIEFGEDSRDNFCWIELK